MWIHDPGLALSRKYVLPLSSTSGTTSSENAGNGQPDQFPVGILCCKLGVCLPQVFKTPESILPIALLEKFWRGLKVPRPAILDSAVTDGSTIGDKLVRVEMPKQLCVRNSPNKRMDLPADGLGSAAVAVRSQFPMLVLMVIYTMVGLWLLSSEGV